MGWKQYVRQAEAAARRREREALRQFRELEKRRKQYEKEARRQAAEDEAQQYEGYLKLLVTIHTECGDEWDWRKVSTTPPPQPPQHTTKHEAAARTMLEAYRPGFFEKLFGGAKKRHAELTRLVETGQVADRREYETALAEYKTALAYWNESVRLAPGVLSLDLRSCADALRHATAFDELASFGTRVDLEGVADDAACLTCTVEGSDAVPTEEVKLTAAGKLTSKEMAAGKYWSLYQDHLCSCAIRVARETFATLPVQRAIVNVRVVRLNASTGHMEPQTVLGVHFTPRGTPKTGQSWTPENRPV